MFVLKKILGHLLMPLPLALALLALGLLLRLRGRRLAARTLFLAGWTILLIAGNRGVAIKLTASLENDFPPAPAAATQAITPSAPVDKATTAAQEDTDGATRAPTIAPGVDSWPEPLRGANFVAVLGGGHGDAPALPAGQRLSTSARARLVEGLRLALALPDAWLVVSGPGNTEVTAADPSGPQTHARVLANAAVELGFPRARIVEIDTARDTAEEVAALHRLAGEESVALVTSAWHLPRAMKLARAEGLAAFPCPSDYLGGRDASIEPIAWVTWDADSLINTTRAWREYLGRAWAALMERWHR